MHPIIVGLESRVSTINLFHVSDSRNELWDPTLATLANLLKSKKIKIATQVPSAITKPRGKLASKGFGSMAFSLSRELDLQSARVSI
jgi:hypothetical protein